jgi:hypothetical protein
MNAFGLVIVPVLTWLLLGSQTTSELIILAAMGFPYVWLAVWDLTHPGRVGRAWRQNRLAGEVSLSERLSCLGGLVRRRRAGAGIGIGDDIVDSIFDRF